MIDIMNFIQLFALALYCACLTVFAVVWSIAMYKVVNQLIKYGFQWKYFIPLHSHMLICIFLANVGG